MRFEPASSRTAVGRANHAPRYIDKNLTFVDTAAVCSCIHAAAAGGGGSSDEGCFNQTARTQLTADRDSNSTTSHCTAVTPTRAALHGREPPRRPVASVLQSTPCSENVHLFVIMPPPHCIEVGGVAQW